LIPVEVLMLLDFMLAALPLLAFGKLGCSILVEALLFW
jgi:hypothetical protein